MITTTKADLRIFRGTYKECVAQEVINMKIYLAWDTGEIFVGNRAGVLVKYGGSQDLEKKLNSLFSELKSEISNTVDKLVEDSINERISAILNPFREEIERYVNSTIEGTVERIRALEDKSDDYAKKDEVPTKLSQLNDDLGIASQDFVLNTVNNKISDIDKNLSNLNSKIEANQLAISQNVPLINENKNVSESNKTRLDTVDSEIFNIKIHYAEKTEVPTKLSQLENDGDFDFKYSTNGYVNSMTGAVKSMLNSRLIFKTGDEMLGISNTTEINNYGLVFCNETSSNGKYKNGVLYYADYNSLDFKAMAGGSSSVEKTKATSLLKLIYNNTTSSGMSQTKWEITDQNIPGISLTATVSHENDGAIDGPVYLRLNGSDLPDNSFDPYSENTFTYLHDLPGNEAGTFRYSLYAASKTSDEYTEYTINNTDNISITIYIPILVGINNSQYIKRTSKSGNYDLKNIESELGLSEGELVGENARDLIIYSPTEISAVYTSDGWGVDIEKLENETIKINNIDVDYKVYNFGKFYQYDILKVE